MTQAPLVFEASLETRIVEAAREQKVGWLTLFDRNELPLQWRCFSSHDGGFIRGGPWLDDFEAAVLIAAGWEWHVYEYDYWPERAWLDGRPPQPKGRHRKPRAERKGTAERSRAADAGDPHPKTKRVVEGA